MGLLVPLLGFDPLLALDRLHFLVGLATAAVVGLVVQDDDVSLAAELAANAVDHPRGRLVEGVPEHGVGHRTDLKTIDCSAASSQTRTVKSIILGFVAYPRRG